jgi:hypothetical protein
MRFIGRFLVAVLLIAFVHVSAFGREKATVVGRFRIMNASGKYYNGKKTLAFSHGNKRKLYHIQQDDSGYFSFTLPPGYNSLTGVGYFSGGHFGLALPKGLFEVKLGQANTVYYIGDITLNWEIEIREAAVEETKTKELAIAGVGSALKKKNSLYNRKEKRSPINVVNEPGTITRLAETLKIDPAAVIVSLLHVSKGS